ncbi:TPA: hypothetical protein ACT192_001422 [Klebsiella oxytoca]
MLSLLFLFFFNNAVFAAAENISLNSSHSLSSVEKTPMATFQQAINDDLTGHHHEARQKYDVLNNGMLAGMILLPSAVNQAALECYDEVRRAFTLLRSRAGLWPALGFMVNRQDMARRNNSTTKNTD